MNLQHGSFRPSQDSVSNYELFKLFKSLYGTSRIKDMLLRWGPSMECPRYCTWRPPFPLSLNIDFISQNLDSPVWWQREFNIIFQRNTILLQNLFVLLTEHSFSAYFALYTRKLFKNIFGEKAKRIFAYIEKAQKDSWRILLISQDT